MTASARPVATAAGCGAIVFAMLFAWSWSWPLAVAAVTTGVFVGMCVPRPRTALAAGGAAGLAGAAAMALLFAQGLPRALVSPNPGTAIDGIPYPFELLSALVTHGPVATLTELGAVGVVVAGAAGTAAIAGMIAWLLGRSRDAARLRRILTVAAVVAVCASFAHTALTTSSPTMAVADREPESGRYANDAAIYLKTYYLMRQGEGFYDALLEAAAGDRRLMEEGSIRDGKYHPGWMWGPAAMRRPTVFHAWRYLAPSGGGIVLLAVVAGAAALASVAWGSAPYLAHRSLFVTVFTMPYALFMTLGRNVFFPDFWGSVAAVIALASIMRRQWVAGAAVLLLSALIRETTGPFLAVAGIVLLVVWVRTGRAREWLRRASAYGAAAAVWFGFERVHEAAGARLMAFAYPSSLQILWQTATSRSLVQKVIAPTTYLLPGRAFPLRGVSLIAVGLMGFRGVLAPEREVRLVVETYLLFWSVFLIVVGATSEYWGQLVILPAFVGAGCLLAAAGHLDRSLELRSPIGWE